jgi:MoxR-like ATPase
MMDWYRGTGERPASDMSSDRPIGQAPASLTDPAAYRPSDDARNAVNVALLMGMPLLVSGEPGSGKTQLGYSVAHELGLETPELFVTKSTSQARDLFYHYDAIGHFHAAQTKKAAEAEPYIRLQALGRAIERARPPEQRLRLASSEPLGERRRSLVIVDEIDKAPRDFPNDLLHEVEDLRFAIPEISEYSPTALEDAYRPILIITTNSEQLLPEPFLRRCAFVHLTPARGEELALLIERRFSGILRADHKLVWDVVDFSDRLREEGQLDRPPGSAELLQFLNAAVAEGADPDMTMAEQSLGFEKLVPLLAKSADDSARLRARLS